MAEGWPQPWPAGPFPVEVLWILESIKRYRYKPGWKLTAKYDSDASAVMLKIDAKVEDSRSPRCQCNFPHFGYFPKDGICDNCGQPLKPKMIDITATYAIHPMDFARVDDRLEILHSTIEGMLANAERHEIREWLRYDGELVDDPHAEEKANA